LDDEKQNFLAGKNIMGKLGKISIGFKSPDAVDWAVDNHVTNLRKEFIANGGKSYEFDEDNLVPEIRQKINKFVRWGEYITVEIDLDNETIRVCGI
jgi:hypothetical protein